MTIDLALRCYCLASVDYVELKPGRAARWLRNWYGFGGQGVANLLTIAACGERYAKMIYVLTGFNVFSRGIEHSIDVLKIIHDVVRRSNMLPVHFPQLLNIGLRPDDWLYLKLVSGRFFFRSLADDGTIQERAG